MANLTFRDAGPVVPSTTTTKNAPLLNIEIDGNFKSLDDAKFEKSGGTISGNVTVAGNVSATNFDSTSDMRLKSDIEKIDNALDKIKRISGYTFKHAYEVTDKRSAGVLAQEVKPDFPEVVNGSGETYYSVNYDGIIAFLIEAIKELDQKIENLKAK